MVDCEKWKNNTLVNPLTNRKILLGGPTYNRILKECTAGQPLDCEKWKINPLINPQTNRVIKLNGPTYAKIKSVCSKSSESPTRRRKSLPIEKTRDERCDENFLGFETLHSQNKFRHSEDKFRQFAIDCAGYYPFSDDPIDGPKLKGSFEANRQLYLIHFFRLFDDTIFQSKLAGRVAAMFNDTLTSDGGYTEYWLKSTRCEIHLSTIVINSMIKLRSILIHEMCHAANRVIDKINDAEHGPKWLKWVHLAEAAFPKLGKIPIKHRYSAVRRAECNYCKTSKTPEFVGVVCKKCRKGKIVEVEPYILRTEELKEYRTKIGYYK
jgi:SprT-like family/2-cysteine adaptor domain